MHGSLPLPLSLSPHTTAMANPGNKLICHINNCHIKSHARHTHQMVIIVITMTIIMMMMMTMRRALAWMVTN